MNLRHPITQREILIARRVCDGLTTALAQDAGFKALYLSCVAVAIAGFGRPEHGK